MGVEQLAEGIIEIANWNQANCIRQMTIQRGIDPRGLALLSFGGSGPAQSPAVMELLGMKACIVPLNPGNLSAFGLLAVDWRTDHIATRVTHEDALDPAVLAGLYRQLEARGDARRSRATASIRATSASFARPTCATSGSRWRCGCRRRAARSMRAFVAALVDAFHAAHEKAFGYSYRGKQKVELVNACVSGFGLIDRPALPKLAGGAPVKPRTARRAFFGGAFVETPSTIAPRFPPVRGSTGRR